MTTKYYTGVTSVPLVTALPRGDNKFSAFSNKDVPVAADVALIEDSADSGAKKKIVISNFTSGGSVFGTATASAGKDGLETTTSGSWTTYSFSSAFSLTGPGKFMVFFRSTLWCPAYAAMAFKIINYTTTTDLYVEDAVANSSSVWGEGTSPGTQTSGFFIVTLTDATPNEYRFQYHAISGNSAGLAGTRMYGFRIE